MATSQEIGSIAGKVWSTLDSNGEMSITAIKKEVGGPATLVDWAIGWLAREGKLAFRQEKNGLKISLR